MSASIVEDTETTARLTLKIDSVSDGDCIGKQKEVMVTLTHGKFYYVPSNMTVVPGTNDEVARVTFSGAGTALNAISIYKDPGYMVTLEAQGTASNSNICACSGYFHEDFTM